MSASSQLVQIELAPPPRVPKPSWLRAKAPVLVAVGLLVLTGISTAADEKAAGKELIEKARKVSNIRAEGAPAFRMQGSFRIIPKKGGKETEGSYEEIWVSKTKWRREVETSSFHRVEVGVNARRWLADSGTDRPESALYAPLTLLLPRGLPDPEVSGMSERQLNSVKVPCAKLGAQGIDCVDPDSGVFLLQEALFAPPNGFNPVRHSCVYGKYEKFGDRLFPRSVYCSNEPGDDVELTISELTAETSADESLFAQPPGATETANCQGPNAPPHAVYSPDPTYPDRHKETATVVLGIIVGTDGKPQDVKIVHSAGKDFDRPALDAVHQWRFKPATCEGTAVPVHVDVEISFRRLF